MRFNFTGRYWGTFLTFIILPILAVLSLYTALPWVLKKMDEFIHSHITYGDKPVSVSTSTGQYYIAAFAAAGAFIFLLIVFIILMSVFGLGVGLMAVLGEESSAGNLPTYAASGLLTVILILVYWVGFTVVHAIYASMIRNHLLNSLVVEDVAELSSNVRVLPFTVLKLSNALILVFTLGIGYPITLIRTARFMANATEIAPLPDAASVVDNLGSTDSAFGEEAAEAFDIDFALG